MGGVEALGGEGLLAGEEVDAELGDRELGVGLGGDGVVDADLVEAQALELEVGDRGQAVDVADLARKTTASLPAPARGPG